MTFPNSLRSQFELIEQLPGEKAIDCYRVRDIRREWAESVVRVLPEKFSADREIVNRFHSFFAQFSAIPNRTFIPAVYSVTGVAGGNVYAVEEYVTGVPLPRFIELRRTSENLQADVIDIFIKVCEALHHAHQRDIYHLCILPADILVDIKNPGRVKLVGFGTQIFKTAGRLDSFSDHCRGYIAPEIFDGKEPKTSADIYSLAAVIRDIFPEVGYYGDLLSNSLSKKPADRPARAREFAQGLKDLTAKKPTQASDKPKPSTNEGGLLPIVQIKSDPVGAEVKLNGKVVGVTSDKGLSLSCARDAVLEISKAGFQNETIQFTDMVSKPEITVKLKSAFRLFTNPWGAIVKVDGLEIGATKREGLVVHWDGHTIEIQKSGYKPETLKFSSPPTETASTVELQMLVAESPTKWDWPKITPYILAGFLLCLAPVLIYNGIYGGPKADQHGKLQKDIEIAELKKQVESEKDRSETSGKRAANLDDQIAKLTTVVADLRGNLSQKEVEIASLKKQVDFEKGRWQNSEKRATNLENEIAKLTTVVADLRGNLNQKDVQIAGLKRQVESEKGRWETSEKKAANLENEISKLRASVTSQTSQQQQSVPPKRPIDHSLDDNLIEACSAGNVQEVQRLLSQGANPDAKTKSGFTGLMYSACRGNLEITKLLLKYGANVDALAQSGDKADDFAKYYRKNDVLSLLENHRRNQKRSP